MEPSMSHLNKDSSLLTFKTCLSEEDMISIIYVCA